MSGQCANPAGVPVLITRPAAQAARFAVQLGAECPQARPILAPMMEVEYLPVALPQGPWQALILTSETGAEVAGKLAKKSLSLPNLALCVGDRTARMAARAGFDTFSAQGAAEDLLALILSRPERDFLWLHGEDIAFDFPAALAAKGRRCNGVPVYRQRALPLPPQALAALSSPGPLILPVFSPRSARLLAAVLPPDAAADLLPVAISPRALACLPESLQSRGSVAAAPEAVAMIRAIVGTIAALAP